MIFAASTGLRSYHGRIAKSVTTIEAEEQWLIPFVAIAVEGRAGAKHPRTEPKPFVRARVMLSNVKLALPTLSLRGGMPQVFPDKRFLGASEEPPRVCQRL